MNAEQKKELYSLLNGLCEGLLNEQQYARLDAILKSNREACEIYVDFTSMWSDFRYFQTSLYSLNEKRRLNIQKFIDSPDKVSDSAIWRALAIDEKTAPTIDLDEEKPQRELIRKVVYPPREKRKIRKHGIFLILNTAAILFLFVFIRFIPPKVGYEVATLVDSIDATWTEGTSSIQTGSRLVTGRDALTLREGMVKLLFDNSAKVLIEAPAEFKILSEGHVKLVYGRLYSKVPPEAVGFTVSTLSAEIIDLGTEFGVEVDYSGDTSLHVIKGKTSLVSGDKSKPSGIQVNAGNAKRISVDTQAVSDLTCDNERFIRDIDSSNHLIWRNEPLQWNGTIEWAAESGNWDNGSNWNVGIKPDPTWSIRLRNNSSVCTLNTKEIPISSKLEVYNGQTLNVENGGYMGCGWSRFGWSTVNMTGNGTWLLNDENLIIGCNNKDDGPCIWTMSDTSKIDITKTPDKEILCIAEDNGVGILRLIGSAVTVNCRQLQLGNMQKPGALPSSATLEYVMDSDGVSTIHVDYRASLSQGDATAHLVLKAPEVLPQKDLVLIETKSSEKIIGNGVFDTLNGGSATEGTVLSLGGNQYTLTYQYDANGDGCNNDIALVYQKETP